MKHRRIGGMPGQTSPVSDDGVSDAARNVVVSIIRKKVEKMLPSVGDKPAHKSQTVWGRIILLLSGAGLIIGKVFVGETDWASMFSWLQSSAGEIVSVVGMVVGGVVEAIGQRRAIAKSGIPTESK